MIAALILAAGASSRMGWPKQLLTFHGRPLLRHAIDAALGGGCRPVIVVIGAHAGLLQAEFRSLPVEFCFNENWEGGLAESIHCGVAALRAHGEQLRAALLMAGQPVVRCIRRRSRQDGRLRVCRNGRCPGSVRNKLLRPLAGTSRRQGSEVGAASRARHAAPLSLAGGRLRHQHAGGLRQVCMKTVRKAWRGSVSYNE